MEITCITAMSKDYYDRIGKIMIDSWLATWPSNYSLHVYSEDIESLDNDAKLINIHDVCDPDLQSYLDYIGTHRSRVFTYKVYSFIHAARNNKGWILWIDADSACIKGPDQKLFDKMFVDNTICAYMGTTMYKDKNGWKGRKNCDSAIISFNTETVDSKKFINEFERLYNSRDINNRDVFPKPNDTHAFIHCINFVNTPSKNINTNQKALSPTNECVGDYFRHFKAGRKDKSKIKGLVDKLISSTQKLSGKELTKRIERVERRYRNDMS